MSLRPPPEPGSLSRTKPRRLSQAIGYRAYRAARRLLPSPWLERHLLSLSWLTERLAYEHAVFRRGWVGALDLIRPDTRAFLLEELPTGAKVIDIGGGAGAISRLLAESGFEVLYVDPDAEQLERARRTCQGHRVLFAQGKAETVARSWDGYRSAVLMHVLEHVDDPVGTLAPLASVLDRLIVEVPDLYGSAVGAMRFEIGGVQFWSDDDHVTEFCDASLCTTLSDAGWSVERLERSRGVILASARPTQTATGAVDAKRRRSSPA